MFLKDKLYLIADKIDDSIKSVSGVYDITIFTSFVEFERYVENVPIIIDTLVITSDVLQFTSTNMMRLIRVINSPFVNVKSSIIYLIDFTYDLKVVKQFINSRNLDKWSIYQGDLSYKFISEILSGEKRDTIEGKVNLITYRMRTEEYLKQEQLRKEEDALDTYFTDEDILSGIPDEEPIEDLVPEVNSDVKVSYIVGSDIFERTLLAFMIAQYHALSGKTLIMEKDVSYHRLSDMVTKSEVICEFIDIEDLIKDVVGVIKRIKYSANRLIILISKNRIEYDYNFLMDILETNLRENLFYIVRECDFEEAPFGKAYTVVMRNTVPDVLKSCNSFKYDINTKDVTFVGMMLGDLGSVNISSNEMSGIISQVIEKNNVVSTIVKAEGVQLKGEELNYDILSIISSTNRR